MAALSLITGTKEGSDSTVSALHPMAVGSAIHLCGPQLCFITPSSSWQVLKISLQKIAGVWAPTWDRDAFCSLGIKEGGWSKMSDAALPGLKFTNWAGGAKSTL